MLWKWSVSSSSITFIPFELVNLQIFCTCTEVEQDSYNVVVKRKGSPVVQYAMGKQKVLGSVPGIAV